MCTQNTHVVDPFDNTVVQHNLLVIPACKQNLREYQPVEEASISVSQARTRKGVCSSYTHIYTYLPKEVLVVVEMACRQESQHSNSRLDNQFAYHNS